MSIIVCKAVSGNKLTINRIYKLQWVSPINMLALGLAHAGGMSIRVTLWRWGRCTGAKSQTFWKISIALSLPVQVLTCCIKMTRLGLHKLWWSAELNAAQCAHFSQIFLKMFSKAFMSSKGLKESQKGLWGETQHFLAQSNKNITLLKSEGTAFSNSYMLVKHMLSVRYRWVPNIKRSTNGPFFCAGLWL